MPKMKSIDDIRRENLSRLRDQLGGRQLADRIGCSESQLSQWINGSKHSVTGKKRGMRTATARVIETACSKEPGWLDTDHEAKSHIVEESQSRYLSWPFSRINQSRFLSLPSQERDFIEGRLLEAIIDAEARIGKRLAS
jgi:transcriptional regulator with XRE-family HTH domain